MTYTTTLHKASTRWHANHWWLDAYHSFSFANWYNPERMQFGMLRVLNDDTVAGGMGFGKHPHDNMEIITIPLQGDLAHKDSMGNTETIKTGDIQVMSAGSGVEHSEFNPNEDDITKLLQIWIFPNQKNVEPRYQQLTLDPTERKNKLQQIVSPYPDDAGTWIHQDAWLYLSDFDADYSTTYQLQKEWNGLYIFVLSGTILVDEQELETRDALGITDFRSIKITAVSSAEFLLIEVPMR